MGVIKKVSVLSILVSLLLPFFAQAASAYPQPQLGSETGLYRLYDPVTNNHLYTVDYNEAFDLNNSGIYHLEGVVGNVFTSQVSGSLPLYRLYSSKLDKHAFLLGSSGLIALERAGYKQEAVIAYILNDPAQYSPTANQGPRLYWLQNSKTRDWLLTTDAGEAGNAQNNGYTASINWYWLP